MAEMFTVAQVAEALRLSAGIYTAAAVMLKCAPNTVRNYVLRHPELAELREEIVNETLDLAEIGLLNILKDPKHRDQLKATTYYLSSKGQDRGYGGGKPGRPKKPETIAAEGLDLTSEEGQVEFYKRLAARALEVGDAAAAMRAVEQLRRIKPPDTGPVLPPMHTPEGRAAVVGELLALPLDLLLEAVAAKQAALERPAGGD